LTEYDLSLQNGSVFVNGDLVEANLGVSDGKIETISKLPVAASRTIDCSGKYVLPGIIDLHAHIRDPGYTYKEDFETGSRAAAAGGVTMFCDMPNVDPPTNSLATFNEKKKIASSKSLVDFNHFVFPTLEEIPAISRAGAAGFKIFMVRGAYPHDPRIAVEDHARLYEMFRAIKETGLLCLVHPSNMALFEIFYEMERKDHPGELKWKSFGTAYTDELIYGTSVSILVQLAKRTGVRLHLVHTHSADAISIIAEAKRNGHSNISAQVDPKYFVTSKDEMNKLGPLVLPGGLLPQERVEKIWEALRNGTIDVLATDHAPHTREEVIEKFEKDPWEAPFGCPQLEHYLSVFLNEVNNGRITLGQLMNSMTFTPAKLINVFPRKGTIQAGSDADFVVVDMRKEKVLTSEHVYTKVKWTPYEGRRVKGVPVMTVRRGEIIMEDGEVFGKPGSGEFIPPLSQDKL